MLQARELTKRYGGLLALDRVSFELRPGEIVGYLGPNGSGKSTTVNLVVGLLEPSAGDLSLCGIRASEDPIAYKRRIGYVPEEPSLYAHLTASDYLMLVGRLRRLPARTLQKRVPELLMLLQLHDSRYRSMTTFSKGMRQRVLVAFSSTTRSCSCSTSRSPGSTSMPGCCCGPCWASSPLRGG